ncbi:hypothetical protein GF336_02670 [Candidatus Woesearchaeota archaeon]|nr:hypothetical protein [Candidatus Woesearchaeota archaeon]
MESRKIQLVGNRSYSVSLPKQWVISNKLKAKDNIFIDKNENNELIIKNTNNEKDNQNHISINLEDISNISEFIMFCYVKNIDQINILIKKQDYGQIRSIRKILTYLEGYDITSESEKNMTISFLFNDISVNIQKLLIRITYLLDLLLASLENKDSSTLDQTETSIDKLYHLSERILFSCINNRNLKKENTINHNEDIFFYKDIFKKLENIGDILVSLRKDTLSKEDINLIKKHVGFLSDLLVKKKSTTELKTTLNKMKISSSNGHIKSMIERINELCKDALESSISIEFNKSYF